MLDISHNPPLFKVQECSEQGEDDGVRPTTPGIGCVERNRAFVHAVPADQAVRAIARTTAFAHGLQRYRSLVESESPHEQHRPSANCRPGRASRSGMVWADATCVSITAARQPTGSDSRQSTMALR